MTTKRIVFTRHARDQIKRRGLTEAWVIDIIRNHHISLPRQLDNTQEYRKERNNTYYYAVVGHKKSAMVVITAGEANKP